MKLYDKIKLFFERPVVKIIGWCIVIFFTGLLFYEGLKDFPRCV